VNWRNSSLKHLAAVSVSNVDKKSVVGDIAVRLVNYTDVYYGERLKFSTALMEATATPGQVQAFGLRRGDVLITKDSETVDDIGIAALVESACDEMVLGYHLALLRPWTFAVDGRFLFWAMCSARARGQLSAGATGVTRFGLRADVISSLVLPTPPIEEQRAIADFLDAETGHIDALIAKKYQLLRLLSNREGARIEEAMGETLKECVRIPVKRLMTESDARLGLSAPLQLLSVSIHRGVVPRDEVTDKLPRADELSAYKVCQAGDVVINRMRAFQGGVGVAPQTGIVSPDYTVLRAEPRVLPSFLHFIFRSNWFVGEMTRRLRGIGGVDQGNVRTPRVNVADLGLILIPVPALEDQRSIASDLERAAEAENYLREKLGRQISLLQERRQALITAAVTGEMEIPGVPA
jgi:type I restriction enzyme S subunit